MVQDCFGYFKKSSENNFQTIEKIDLVAGSKIDGILGHCLEKTLCDGVAGEGVYLNPARIKKEKIDFEKIKSYLQKALSYETCMKHPVACVIETTKGQYILGWNGAPTQGIEHTDCLRKGFPSGHGMEKCPSVHAERRAISLAAKNGHELKGGTIYMAEWFPCADCAKSIVEAGLAKLVTPDDVYFDIEKRTLVPKLQNQPYNFEMAEKLIGNTMEIIVDPRINPYAK